jgi:pyruvate,water dikinase
MWNLDRSHFPGGTTPMSTWFMEGCAKGMRKAFEELGMPADTLDVRFVRGFMYSRLRPLISPDRAATKLPPEFVLKVVVRLHPSMRKRANRAARAIDEKPWLAVLDEWQRSIRPRLEATNEELQSVDVAQLDDIALADHLDRLMSYCRDNFELHFYLHAYDLGPIGFLLAECSRWGIDAPEVVPALAGASPATSAPARILRDLRSIVAASGTTPETLDDVRSISPEATKLVDQYFARRGRMMVTRYDLDGRTLEEQPEVVLGALLSASAGTSDEAHAAAVAARLRERVPAGERMLFDERLADARATMDLRDDNGPNTVELPVGILRYALLEAGRRAMAAGRIRDAELTFELEPGEVVPFVRDGAGPSGDELEERARRRHADAMLEPPVVLGPTEVTPPLAVLAPPHQTFIGAVQLVLDHIGMKPDEVPAGGRMRGAGVGTEAYQGTARVASSPEEALDEMNPGDVLVVRFTTPAYNTVLMIAGAVVTTEGALLSHAAVMARELGIPAVIGASGALDEIPNGAEVQVDPVAGTVSLLVAN